MTIWPDFKPYEQPAHARLLVDANTGWSPEEAVAQIRRIEPLGLELIEQPVAEDDIQGMGYVQANTNLPVVADDPCARWPMWRLWPRLACGPSI